MAETKRDALAAFDAFVESWGVKYDKAAECLIKDREAVTIETAPTSLGSFREFEDHGQRGLVRETTFRAHGAVTHGRKRAFDDVGRAQRFPVLSGEVVEGEQRHPRCKVHRRNGGRQIARPSRCRLTPSVTKIRR